MPGLPFHFVRPGAVSSPEPGRAVVVPSSVSLVPGPLVVLGLWALVGSWDTVKPSQSNAPRVVVGVGIVHLLRSNPIPAGTGQPVTPTIASM